MSAKMKACEIGPSPIERISYAAVFEWHGREKVQNSSLPGHLLHATVSGKVEMKCNGRTYIVRAGDVLWYHEDEWVEVNVLKAPWIFYSINFTAQTLPPPSFESRLFTDKKRLIPAFKKLLRYWEGSPEFRRDLMVHSCLLQIVAELGIRDPRPIRTDESTRLWWELENKLRSNLDKPITIQMMSELVHRSKATISRSARQATGKPPLKRMKQVRMSMARGLVKYSSMTMTQISQKVGYGRIHEFSRDYRQHFGRSPTLDRKAALKKH